jgi:ribosomal protein S18 acetylase RimI-like enzyme
MGPIHPSEEKVAALRRRWVGQEKRLQAIAEAMLRGEDWTVHLQGLPYVSEVPPLPGEACARDLRGAPLRRALLPAVEVRTASLRDVALVAGIALEGMRSNTPLPDASPFPVEGESAEDVATAMRRGARFLVAESGKRTAGVVRWVERGEFRDLTAEGTYAEISGLAVLPAWRRLGIGAALLRGAERDAKENGQEWALLRTTLELGLVPWYERLGYAARCTRQATRPGEPACLDVVMTRRLPVSPPPPHPTRTRAGAGLNGGAATRSAR